MLKLALVLAIVAPHAHYDTPASACHGRGWYSRIAIQDVPSGLYLKRRWNRDHDRLLFRGVRGTVYFDGVRVANRSRHRVRVHASCR